MVDGDSLKALERPPFLNKQRTAAWGLVLSLASMTAYSMYTKSASPSESHSEGTIDTWSPQQQERYQKALFELLRSAPKSPVQSVEAFGLHEVIPLRSANSTALTPQELSSYLSIMTSQGKDTEVIAAQGDYKKDTDPTGNYISNPTVATLQKLTMNLEDADGLFGPKTAAAFYTALQEVNSLRPIPFKLALPQDVKDLDITVSMAVALIDWSQKKERPDDPSLALSLSTQHTALFYDELTSSPAYLLATPEQQSALHTLLVGTTLEGRGHLINLCHRRSPETANLTLFETMQHEDGERSVLNSLCRLLTLPMNESDDTRREKIIEGALAELDPFNINQGSWNRCGADVIDFDLHLRYPALAAFVTTQVFDVRCATLGEHEVERDDVYLSTAYISPTESRRQATFMEAANGPLDYNPEKDCNMDETTQERVSCGLFSSQTAQLLSELTGDDHVCYSSYDSIQPSTLCLLLKKLTPGDKFSYLDRYLSEEELTDLSERERAGRTEVRTAHIVSFLGIDPLHNEVHFRTWGKTTRAEHEVIPSENGSLEMRVVDPRRGIYAVKLSVLEEHIQSVIVRDYGGLPQPQDLMTL